MKHQLAIFTILTAIVTVVMLLALDAIACRTDPNYGFTAQIVTAACCFANATLAAFAALQYAHT